MLGVALGVGLGLGFCTFEAILAVAAVVRVACAVATTGTSELDCDRQCQMMSVGIHLCRWVPVGVSGCQWVPVGVSRCQWVPDGACR